MCEHHHDHDYDHPHDHGHTGLEERVAMLTYMLGHNQHHAQELHELAHDLGDSEAAQLIHDDVVVGAGVCGHLFGATPAAQPLEVPPRGPPGGGQRGGPADPRRRGGL